MILVLFIYLLMNVLTMVILILILLVGVAYLTLFERKVLGYIHNRKGPNKVGILGVFQPISDALKLFCKEIYMVYKSNFFMFYFCPVIFLMMMLFNWLVVPWVTNIYCMNYSMLFMFVLMSLNSYLLLMIGWSSNSMYSLMGTIRLVAQVISYEVSFMLIIYGLMILSESYSLSSMIDWQVYLWNLIFMFPLFIMFFFSILAEMNRSPMDLIEGESELVSGFNVEYYGGGFAFIFIGEYGMIIFFSYVLIIMYTGMEIGGMMMMFMHVLILMLIIYMRGMLPRIRYDELMYMCWKIILPLILNYLIYVFGIKCILILLM